MKIIAVIPARGGSKGIPRKNLRPLLDKPLIYYSIKTAGDSKYIEDVVVSTEDEEISEIALLYGAEVVKRPPELSEDSITLDPVIYHAVTEFEDKRGTRYDYVVTLQPTSPLLSPTTLDRAIETIINGEYDTIISATAERHLYWEKREGKLIPMYKERKNRQFLNPIYQESGAFLISRRDCVSEGGRIGKNTTIYLTPEDESVDIDSLSDWWIAENILKKLKIVIRTDGGGDIGMGHVYRGLTIANRLGLHHDIIFLMDAERPEGINKVMENNYPIKTFHGDACSEIEKLKPNIVINDILDTSEKYIECLKGNGLFVVNFEDLGGGSRLADVVINALYESTSPPDNHYFGHRYVCLRDEFLFMPPVKTIRRKAERILITFGGSDPGNLTIKTLKALSSLNLKDIEITVIIGSAYGKMEELRQFLETTKMLAKNAAVKRDIKNMAREISEADIVITSNGRTIYEVTSMGVPCISISQNEREMRHLFSYISGCVINLGLFSGVTEETIATTVEKLLADHEKREEINRAMRQFELRKGIERVTALIIQKYREREK